MSSPFLGLRTCIYKVNGLTAAKEWYAKVFKIEPYFDEPFYVGFNVGGFELGLMPKDSSNDKTENIHTLWGVEDIESVFQMMIDNGATALEQPANVGGELMVATVKDPWGNVLGIIYNPYFKIDKK